MERGKYRFELGQIIKGENGEYVITKREKRKDYTKKQFNGKGIHWFVRINMNLRWKSAI